MAYLNKNKLKLSLTCRVILQHVVPPQGPDMLLTMAFTDQFYNIGWYYLLMGRMSHKWGVAVAAYMEKPNDKI
jgi:hypothetical protein